MRSASKVVSWALLATCVAPLYACSFLDSFVPAKGKHTDVIDRNKSLTLQDFKDLGTLDKAAEAANATQDTNISGAVGAPPVPDIAQVLAAPRPPKVSNAKLVTLAVTDDVPLRDVLFELGRLANVDIEVGPGLDKSGINLRATDRPFNEVIERISTLGHLRYSVTGNSMRVERDLPYLKNYSLDFLNLVRSSTSSYTLSTGVVSGGSGGGSSGGSSSSSSSSGGGSSDSGGGVGTSQSSSGINVTAESDLWSSLEASITEILAYKPEGESADSAASGAASGATAGKGSLVINRQAGVLSVNGTERQQEMVQNFLTLMSRNASAQVLIEAKIVEVALSDQFASGIDWNHVIGDVNGRFANRLSLGQYLPTVPGTGTALKTDLLGNPAVTFGIENGDLGAVMALTQTYGTTRTLSSPRLSAINNQQAVLTFARNVVYFDCTYTPASATTSTSGPSTSTAATLTCDKKTTPIGIILNILPSINLDSQEVTLNVRPTLTRQVGTATSPTVGFLKSQATSQAARDQIPDIPVPIVEVREIDSITKVKSGGVMIIGGLMEDVSRNTETGIPGASELPIFGNLFKSRSEDTTKRELIIFIKATIVNTDGSTHKVDRAVYDKFVTDPRPLFQQQH